MFDKSAIVPNHEECQTFFEASFMSIKSDLCDIANSYLNIAFKVYEINVRIRKDGKKCKYKNIVEACEAELGFKKSTTYNMINIVKTYGLDDKGQVSYQQLFTYSDYSYSQLVEMLSLGSVQRADITPDTPVSEIRALKAASTCKQNSSRRLESLDTIPEVVQTSGKVDEVCENLSGQIEILPPVGSVTEELLKFFDSGSELTIFRENGEIYIEANEFFYQLVGYLRDFFDDLDYFLIPEHGSTQRLLNSYQIKSISMSEVVEKFNAFYPVFSHVVNAFTKLYK